MNRTIGCSVLVILSTVVACSANPESTASEADELAARPYREIAIHLGPNGEVAAIHERNVALDQTMTERRAQHGGTTTQSGETTGTTSSALTVDSACAWSDFAAFDQPSFRGNAICIYGAGYVDLGSLKRRLCSGGRCFDLSWSGAIRSWETGPKIIGQKVGFDGGVPEGDTYVLCGGFQYAPYAFDASVPATYQNGRACAYYARGISFGY